MNLKTQVAAEELKASCHYKETRYLTVYPCVKGHRNLIGLLLDYYETHNNDVSSSF